MCLARCYLIEAMKTVEEVRRERLKMLVEEHGSLVELNSKTGKTSRDSTYSQILTRAAGSKTQKAKEMGSAMARSLEEALGKPRGWMDTAPTGSASAESFSRPVKVSPWPFPRIPEAQLRALPESDRNRIEGALALAIAQLGLGVDVTPVVLAASSSPGPVKQQQTGDVLPIGSPANDDYIEIPQYDVRMSAGSGALAFEANPRNKLAFRKSFLRTESVRPANAIVVYADGISMLPVIPHRAALLINRGDTSLVDGNNGKVFGFRFDGELRVKRLVLQDDGTIVARSYNPDFKDVVLDGSIDFEIIGRVVWMGTRL